MLIRLGALFLIGALLFVFHGIRYYLTPWSQAIINGIVKYTYPHTGQKETTVLLFREENLQQLKEPYPVSYERHAMVVDALASFEPRAIFMDFVFMDKRDGIDKLQQAICDARDPAHGGSEQDDGGRAKAGEGSRKRGENRRAMPVELSESVPPGPVRLLDIIHLIGSARAPGDAWRLLRVPPKTAARVGRFEAGATTRRARRGAL